MLKIIKQLSSIKQRTGNITESREEFQVMSLVILTYWFINAVVLEKRQVVMLKQIQYTGTYNGRLKLSRF